MEHLPIEVLGELLSILTWLLLGTAASVISLLAWIGKAVIKRLTGIETQLMQTNSVLATIESDFQKDITELDRRQTSEIFALDRRVAIVETRCTTNHSIGQ